MAVIQTLNVLLKVPLTGFNAGMKGAGKAVSGFGSMIAKLRNMASASFASIAGMAGTMIASFGILGAGAFIGWGVKVAAENEKARVSFTTMLGSAEQATTLLNQIAKFAGATPFDTPELRESAQALLSFGVTADKIMPMIKTLGDVASGSGAEIKDLALIYGKTLAKGKFELEQGNQLAERGIPIYRVLSEQLGVSQAALMKMISAGKISSEQVKTAFESMSASGGIFEDAMKKQSFTLLGAWAGLTDGIGMIAGDLGDIIVDAFNLVDATNNLAEWTSWVREQLANLKPYLLAYIDIWRSIAGAVWDFGAVVVGVLTPVFNWFMSFFGSGFGDIRDTFLTVIFGMQWGIENFSNIFWLYITKIAYQAERVGNVFVHIFGTVIPNVISGFAGSIGTFFTNMLANLGSIIGEIWDYIYSFGEDAIEFEWEPVFVAPVIEGMERQLSETEKALLDSITEQENAMNASMGSFIDGKMAEINKVAEKAAEVSLEPITAKIDQPKEETDKSDKKQLEPAKALEFGTAAAFSAIQDVRRGSDPELKELQKQTKVAEDSNKKLDNIDKNTSKATARQLAPI